MCFSLTSNKAMSFVRQSFEVGEVLSWSAGVLMEFPSLFFAINHNCNILLLIANFNLFGVVDFKEGTCEK